MLIHKRLRDHPQRRGRTVLRARSQGRPEQHGGQVTGPAALMDSQKLWLLVQEAKKRKPVHILAWREIGLRSLHL